MQFVKAFESQDARLGSVGPLLLALYRGSATVAVLDELGRAQEALLAKYPRISTLTVIGQIARFIA